MLDSLSQAWEMRWRLSNPLNVASVPNMPQQVSRTVLAGPLIPSDAQVQISIYLTSWMLSKIAVHCLMFCTLEGLLSHCLPWVCLGAVKQTTHACHNVWGNLQVASFEATWQENMKQMQLHYGLLEPYVSLRKVLFQVLNRHDYLPRHLLEFATLARKVCGSLFPILSFFCFFIFFHTSKWWVWGWWGMWTVDIYLVAEIQNCCGICNCNVELLEWVLPW